MFFAGRKGIGLTIMIIHNKDGRALKALWKSIIRYMLMRSPSVSNSGVILCWYSLYHYFPFQPSKLNCFINKCVDFIHQKDVSSNNYKSIPVSNVQALHFEILHLAIWLHLGDLVLFNVIPQSQCCVIKQSHYCSS